MNILDRIAEVSRARVTEDKKSVPPDALMRQCEEIVRREIEAQEALRENAGTQSDICRNVEWQEALRENAETQSDVCRNTEAQKALHGSFDDASGVGFFEGRFAQVLRAPGLRFICEIKRASPSRGLIAEEFPYLEIAAAYADAGADAISCLTEPRWFLGSDRIFTEVRARVETPMLRKDFVVDAYQLYQAKCMGADATLLICAILDEKRLAEYLRVCTALRLDALVEAHDAEEIAMAVDAGARIIGVNNRNLKDFTVDFDNAARLRRLIPKDCLYVAESGIKGAKDAAALKAIGADACLIGEALMRAADKGAMLHALRNAVN